MTELESLNSREGTLLDTAVAAVLSEEIPPGPPDSVAEHLTETWQRSAGGLTRRRVKSRLLSLALAGAVIFGGAISWQLVDTRGNIALADVAKEFHKARSIQFRIIHYAYAFGNADHSLVWREVSCEECSFKAPGFRRDVNFGHDGIPWHITTEDSARGIKLELTTNLKRAVLTEEGPPTPSELRQGLPSNLVMLEEWLKHGEVRKQLGMREIQGRSVVGLRVGFFDREADFWVDRQTRQIVRFLEPTAAVYDPENDPAAKNPIPPNAKIFGQASKGWVWTDIIYDPPLDEAQYVLTPPDDYTLERIRYREPAEKDLLEWLEVFAQVRGGTFNDDENSSFSRSGEINTVEDKPADQRTAWDEKFLRGYIEKEEVSLKGGGHSAVVRFRLLHDDTWHYQGKGVKLGDGKTPICWYRPQGATAYRVVYGDLSVRDVAPKDLPPKR
jgi:hypothetical protein